MAVGVFYQLKRLPCSPPPPTLPSPPCGDTGDAYYSPAVAALARLQMVGWVAGADRRPWYSHSRQLEMWNIRFSRFCQVFICIEGIIMSIQKDY